MVPTGSTGARMLKESSANSSTNEVDSEVDLIQENLDLKREVCIMYSCISILLDYVHVSLNVTFVPLYWIDMQNNLIFVE